MTDTLATTVSDGFTVTSNSETKEQLDSNLNSETKPEGEQKTPLSDAAAELGKEGGKATAARRAEEAKTGKETPSEVKEAPSLTPGDETGTDGKPLGKPRHDPRARMLEATREAAEAKRERDAIRAEKERLAAEIAALKAKTATPEPPKPARAEDAEPQEEDFDNYKDYVKAAARYEFQQAQKQAEKHRQELAYHEQVGKTVESFVSRMNKAEAADPTYTERVAPLAVQLKPSFKRAPGEALEPIHVITDELISAEHAPALALHLAEHPDELQRLMALRTPLEVQLAMAKLEAKIEAGLEAAPTATGSRPEVSKAPPPERPVSGAPHTADSEPGENASYEEHKRYWDAQDRKRAAARR